MTELQKLALDAVDQLGSMTLHELETACLVSASSRGGFRSSLRSLFVRGLFDADECQIHITRRGVHAIEAHNTAAIQQTESKA